MIYRRLFEKGSMKTRLRLDIGTMKALSMYDQWNSGSMHVYRLLIIIVQARCTMTKFDVFCYGCDHQHRALSLVLFVINCSNRQSTKIFSCQSSLERSAGKLYYQNNFNEAYQTQDSLLMYESDGLKVKIKNI